MAENPLKYSDLLQPDNSIEQAITQLQKLNETYSQTLKTVKDEAIKLQTSVQGVSGATEEHRQQASLRPYMDAHQNRGHRRYHADGPEGRPCRFQGPAEPGHHR